MRLQFEQERERRRDERTDFQVRAGALHFSGSPSLEWAPSLAVAVEASLSGGLYHLSNLSEGGEV